MFRSRLSTFYPLLAEITQLGPRRRFSFNSGVQRAGASGLDTPGN